MNKYPVCGSELNYDEVDVGVGIIRGNFRCDDCGYNIPEERICDIGRDLNYA